MISPIAEYLDQLKDAFIPTVAKAEDEEDVDDDEEEEECSDQLEKLKEECKNTESAKPLIHHYMECVKRVEEAQEQPNYEDLSYKEDCVEEFFHLQHYLDGCAAPKLFSKLK